MKHYNTYIFSFYGTLANINIDETSPSFWEKMADFFTGKNAPFNAYELENKYNSYILDEKGNVSEHLCAKTPGEERWPEIELDKVFYWLYSDKFEEHAPINTSIPLATEATAIDLDWTHDFVDAVAVTPELLHSTMNYFRAQSASGLELYAGAVELLRALRATGSRVILLCNSQRSFAEAELQALGLWDEFDDRFFSSDHECRKPDTYFFNSPILKYSLTPSDCLMIGNELDNDILGAKKAGMDAFYIHSALSEKLDNPVDTALAAGADYALKDMDLHKLKDILLSN